MNYNEAEKFLNEIRDKDEMMFRMAISHLIDVGTRHLTDEMVEQTCNEIMTEDDTHSFMTNEYKCELVRTAAKIAEVGIINMLVYVTRNVHYSV